MVDFSKFGRQGRKDAPIDPLQIFLTLPKIDVNDLYQSQSQVLSNWFEKRDTKDTIIKLHTGGGKTLVGLLIAKSIMNEKKGPVLYLVPNRQLVTQVFKSSQQYGIGSEVYDESYSFTEKYYRGENVLIGTFAALFNGRSKFGILGGNRQVQQLQGVIVDDSHIAPSIVREQFSLRIQKENEKFSDLRNLFKEDFHNIGKIGVFEDMAIGRDSSTLEVPYWALRNKSRELRIMLQEVAEAEEFSLRWPLIRDGIDNCHVLITSSSVVITPIALDMDLLPSFSECPRRIFMSATIRSNDEIIRAFDLRKGHMQTLTAKTVAGIGEKMIISPDLVLGTDSLVSAKKISKQLQVTEGSISVIVPSEKVAKTRWSDFGKIVMKDEISARIDEMGKSKTNEPTIFVNRYDGMDLKGDACRILILDGLPAEISEYDRYKAICTTGGESSATIVASRIEQGIGRSSRGSGDYSIVFLVGQGLTNWINLTRNTELLTVSTRSQVDMGTEITKSFSSTQEVSDFASQCLKRDPKWIEFHNGELVAALENDENYRDENSSSLAFIEREFYDMLKQGRYSEAYEFFKSDPAPAEELGRWTLGWYKQLAARAAFFSDKMGASKMLQEQAFNLNKSLFRPMVLSEYQSLNPPVSQCTTLKDKCEKLRNPKGILSFFRAHSLEIDMRMQTARQFEESLKVLGEYFGFETERPDNDYGNGPDVLWLTPNNNAFVIEVKSEKNAGNAFNKEDNGQLLNSCQWFENKYSGMNYTPIAVLPQNLVTGNAQLHPKMRIMSKTNLESLISAGTELMTKVSAHALNLADEAKCSSTFKALHLDFNGIANYFTETPVLS